jgi:hypothetical protein
MACSISITSATLDQSTGNIIVQGLFSLFNPCSGTSVTVSVTCGSQTFTGNASFQPIPGTAAFFWTAVIPIQCKCNEPVTITATSNCGCQVSQTINNLCCCPKISNLTATIGNCDASGNRSVDLNATITVFSNCPVTVQWDFGDGAQSSQTTFSGVGTYSFPVTHLYSAGTYFVSVKIIEPSPCESNPLQVIVAPCTPTSCCPSITTIADVLGCDANNNRIVTFKMNVNLIAGCPPIIIQWNYGDGTFSPAQTISTSGNYSFTHAYNPVNSPYTATLIFISPTTCPPASIQVVTPPCTSSCCPTVNVTTDIGECNIFGKFKVKFDVNISTPAGCPPPLVQLDYGDVNNNNSGTHSSSFSTTFTYNTNNAPYTATVNTILPTGCPSKKIPIDVGKCCKTFLQWFCPLLFGVMTFSMAIGLFLILFSSCIPDPNTASTVAAIGAVLIAVAIVALIFYLIFCTKCKCGWFYLFLWRVLFGVGILYAIFADCCGGTSAFLIGLGLLLLGVLFLLLWQNQCKKTLCELLEEVILLMSGYIIPVAAFVLSIPALMDCLYVLFVVPGINFPFSFYLLVTIIYAIIVGYYFSNCKQ